MLTSFRSDEILGACDGTHKNRKRHIADVTKLCNNTNSYLDFVKALSHLDIDEGIRVSSSERGKKIFINKNASGQYVTEIVKDSTIQSDLDDVIRHFDTVEEVVNVVRSEFKNNFDFDFY